MNTERWLPVPDFDGYEVSDRGRVRSRKRGTWRVLRGGPSRGYPTVILWRDGHRTTAFVHRLVARAFLGPRPDGMEVRHIDGRRDNCALSNLAYGSRSANQSDRALHGTHYNAAKTHCRNGHEFTPANTYLRKRLTGGRSCRACRRVSAGHATNSSDTTAA